MKKLLIFALFLFSAQHSFAQFLGASGTGNGFIYDLKVNKGGYACYSSSKMTFSGNFDYTVFPSGIIYDQNYYTFGGSAQFLATNEAYHRFQRTQNVVTVNLLGKTTTVIAPNYVVKSSGASNWIIPFQSSIKAMARDEMNNLLVLCNSDTLYKYDTNKTLVWAKKVTHTGLTDMEADKFNNIYLSSGTKLVKLNPSGVLVHNTNLAAKTWAANDEHGGFYWKGANNFYHLTDSGVVNWTLTNATTGYDPQKLGNGDLVFRDYLPLGTYKVPKKRYNYLGVNTLTYNLTYDRAYVINSLGYVYSSLGYDSYVSQGYNPVRYVYVEKFDTLGSFVGSKNMQIYGVGNVPHAQSYFSLLTLGTSPVIMSRGWSGQAGISSYYSACVAVDPFYSNARMQAPVADYTFAPQPNQVNKIDVHSTSTGLPTSARWSAVSGIVSYIYYANMTDASITAYDTIIALKLTVSNPLGSSSITKTISYSPQLYSLLANHSLTLCNGDSVTLSSNNSANTNFRWSNGRTSPTITVTPSTAGTYWLEASSYPYGFFSRSYGAMVQQDTMVTPTITQNSNILNYNGTNTVVAWYFNGNAIPNSQTNTITVLQTGSYFVEVASPNVAGCTARSVAVQMIALNTASNNLVKNALNIANTGVAGQYELNLVGDGIKYPTNIQITDAMGKEIMRLQANTSRLTIDLSSYAEGLYWVQTPYATKKLVKTNQ